MSPVAADVTFTTPSSLFPSLRIASPSWTPARYAKSSSELQDQVMTALLSQRRLAITARAAAANGGARKRRAHLGTLTSRFLIHRVLCYISDTRPVVRARRCRPARSPLTAVKPSRLQSKEQRTAQ